MTVLRSTSFSLPAMSLGSLEILAVVSEDAMGDQAVYVGIVPGNMLSPKDARTKANDWVESHGAKQTFRDALNYFNLDESKYRR